MLFMRELFVYVSVNIINLCMGMYYKHVLLFNSERE